MEGINFIEFAPILVVALVFLVQQRLVVTPEQLERKHREILEDVEGRFAPSVALSELKSQFTEVKEKIDKIYDVMIQR